jgi:hypothetical protein
MLSGIEHGFEERVIDGAANEFEFLRGFELLFVCDVPGWRALNLNLRIPGVAILEPLEHTVPTASQREALPCLEFAKAKNGLNLVGEVGGELRAEAGGAKHGGEIRSRWNADFRDDIVVGGEDPCGGSGVVDGGALGGAQLQVGIAADNGSGDDGGQSDDYERAADCLTNRFTSTL